MSRIYGKGEQPSNLFNQFYGSNRFNRYFYSQIGRVVDVDYDRYKIKVEWLDGGGSPEWFPISFPYVGPASQMGAMPEIGAFAICTYIKESETGKGVPLSAAAFLPVALQGALEHNSVRRLPDSLSTEEDNLFFLKFRKLIKGDMIMSSQYGGEILVNRDVEVKDGFGDCFLLRSSDQSIIMTSLNHFVFTNGVAMSAGPIIRNKMQGIFDASGNRIPNGLARELSLSDGRDNIYVVPIGQNIQEGTLFYSEYRLDVDEITDGTIDINDINQQSVASNRDPIVSLIMGNYAGHDDLSPNLGKMLRPMLFSSPTDTEGYFSLLECAQNKGVDEVSKIGVAFAVHLLKNGGFMGFDKEGHYYLNMNASTSANPMGAGRSMSMLAQGSLKEIWGSTADTGNSWDLSTKGGIQWDIGRHNGRRNNRSIDIRTSNGVNLDIQGDDQLSTPEAMFNGSDTVVSGFAYRASVGGNQKIEVQGSETLQVSGESSLIVDGLRVERLNAATYQYQGNKSENCGDTYSQVVVKEMQGNFGKRKDMVKQGQELTVLTGDIKETIQTFGSRKTNITKGNIEEIIIAGDKKINIITGNYKVSVGAGGIDIKALGSAKLTGLKGVTIQGLKTDIKSATVNLGVLPLKGGVVTGLPGTPSTTCYITGIPPRGSLTVKASI
jgi:hypothetical protein